MLEQGKQPERPRLSNQELALLRDQIARAGLELNGVSPLTNSAEMDQENRVRAGAESAPIDHSKTVGSRLGIIRSDYNGNLGGGTPRNALRIPGTVHK